MSKELESSERLRNTLLAKGYWQDVLQDVAIIETALDDFEWIISKVDLDFLNRLSDLEEKFRFLIMLTQRRK